jgi:IMP dehydrogenase
VPEGIEGRVPYKGSVLNVITQLIGGLRLQHGLHRLPRPSRDAHQAEFVRVSAAGMRESHVHDVQITKEAPNYPITPSADRARRAPIAGAAVSRRGRPARIPP